MSDCLLVGDRVRDLCTGKIGHVRSYAGGSLVEIETDRSERWTQYDSGLTLDPADQRVVRIVLARNRPSASEGSWQEVEIVDARSDSVLLREWGGERARERYETLARSKGWRVVP